MISPSWAPTTTDAGSVGGKASSLFRLIELGARVPPFFVLTTDGYRAQRNGRLSAAARREVLAALEHMDGAKGFAVRSSGVAEDSGEHSFAGVFETCLDVRGGNAVIEAIETCWASHRGARAAAYRSDRGVTRDDAMAVIVQRMVAAEWAGVCFTADPVAQALSVVVVNAVEGGGDALVSGLVNPEEIWISRGDGVVADRKHPPGGTPLPTAILWAAVSASVAVADAIGFPQDLEWACEDGAVFLLQSRPITTIAGVFHNRALEAGEDPAFDANDRIWTRAYADEVWTPPVSPLFYDVQNLSHHIRSRLARDGDDQGLPASIFKYYRAAPYADAAVLARIYRNLPRRARRDSLLAQLPLTSRSEVASSPQRLKPILRRLWQFEFLHRRKWSLAGNHRFLERSWSEFLDAASATAAVDVGTLDEKGLDAHIADIWSLALLVGIECEIAVLYHAHDLKLLLTGLLDHWLGAGDEIYSAASAGLADSHTVRESDEIWQIAQAIRDVGADFASRARRMSLAEMGQETTPDVQEVVAAIDEFLRRHRHRGANYKDVIYPRWGDDRELLWNQIRPFIAVPGVRPRDANAAAGESRKKAQRAAVAQLRGWRRIYRKPLLRRLFRYNEIYSSLRDNHRFYYDYVWWLLHRAYSEIGRRLTARGSIDRPEDIFFLSRPEIDALRSSTLSIETAGERIATRRSEWLETRREQPPKFLRGGYAGFLDREPSQTGDDLHGVPASPGEVTGRARIAHEIADLERLEAGDILVTRQTDPAWTTAFSRLSGLVLETGGALAHGASLCREFGLPCVTAVERATSLIRDGDLVLLSGAEGTVSIIERGVAPAQSASSPSPL